MQTSQDQGRSPGQVADPRGTIFIVDDEPMLLELASLILEPLGCRIRTFRDPQTALDAFGEETPRPCLLITDCSMNGLTGPKLMQACRRLEPELKILVVSGTVHQDAMQRFPEKPTRFLPKPYEPRQLAEAVEGMLPQ